MADMTKGEALIIVGLTALVEEEGMTPHEALDKARQLGKDCYFALVEIRKEKKNENTNSQSDEK